MKFNKLIKLSFLIVFILVPYIGYTIGPSEIKMKGGQRVVEIKNNTNQKIKVEVWGAGVDCNAKELTPGQQDYKYQPSRLCASECLQVYAYSAQDGTLLCKGHNVYCGLSTTTVVQQSNGNFVCGESASQCDYSHGSCRVDAKKK